MTISEQTGHKKQKVLFEEIDFTGSDKVIILNKPKLLEMIEAACNQASLASLRDKIFAMRGHLSNFKADSEGLLNIGTNGDTVQINQKYLFGELRQIVETQTLDRAKYYAERLEKALTEIRTNKINGGNPTNGKIQNCYYCTSKFVSLQKGLGISISRFIIRYRNWTKSQ